MGVKTIIRRLYYLTKQLGYMLSGKPHAKGFIFCMHRVSDLEDGKIVWNENMKIPPSDLDRIITYVKERYDIIRLEDVPMRMKEKHKRKFVVFSLDDGYKDNYCHALKVFQKHDVPFTVFLCSDFMDRKAILWWYTLEDIVLTNETVTLGNGKIFNCKTKTDKELAFLKIREEIFYDNIKELKSDLKRALTEFDKKWTLYEEKYINELIQIEEQSRRFIIEGINLEKELTKYETRTHIKGSILINDKKYNIVGSICMDMLMVEVDSTIELHDKVYVYKDTNHIKWLYDENNITRFPKNKWEIIHYNSRFYHRIQYYQKNIYIKKYFFSNNFKDITQQHGTISY